MNLDRFPTALNSACPSAVESLQDEVNRLTRKTVALEQRLDDYMLARDVAEYGRLQQVIKLFQEHFGASVIDTAGFQALWKQSEDIKNQYGGHVPTLK